MACGAMRAVSIFLVDWRCMIIGRYWLRKYLHALLNSRVGLRQRINFGKAPTQYAAHILLVFHSGFVLRNRIVPHYA